MPNRSTYSAFDDDEISDMEELTSDFDNVMLSVALLGALAGFLMGCLLIGLIWWLL